MRYRPSEVRKAIMERDHKRVVESGRRGGLASASRRRARRLEDEARRDATLRIQLHECEQRAKEAHEDICPVDDPDET